MPRAQGHGNPHWTREETILALDLYLRHAPSVPSKTSRDVVELSKLLRSLPLHAGAAKNDTFRNADGVAFKLLNLRNVATGKGLQNVSTNDRSVWAELGTDPKRVADLAKLIRQEVASNDSSNWQDDSEEIEFAEGRLLTRVHKARERKPQVRKELIEKRAASGGLKCDVCNDGPRVASRTLMDAEFEAHHIVPIAAAMERKTRLQDMALLCACCHRLIHRAIADQKRWLSIAEARSLLAI
jgi:5-methylcytosine-specific restriction protein A